MAQCNHDELQTLIEKGLKRSALKAREIALQTDTPLVVEIDGKVQQVKVTSEDVQKYKDEIKDAL